MFVYLFLPIGECIDGATGYQRKEKSDVSLRESTKFRTVAELTYF